MYVRELGGGVALKSEQRIVAQHAMSIVGDAKQAAAPGFGVDQDPRGSSVEGILKQLFDDRSRPFDNFACGDFVCDNVRENANAAQGFIVAWRRLG